MSKGGLFFVLEGLNGCGKGTHLPKMIQYLYEKDKSNTIFLTREPNEFDENGRLAREMLKSEGDPYTNAQEAVKYFALNRKSHNQIFNPILERSGMVLSDRYWHSNFAFQKAQGISYEQIAQYNQESKSPDLTIILDVPIENIIERLQNRDGEKRRKFDSQKEFLEKVRKNYLELPQILPTLIRDNSIQIIDGTGTVSEVWERIKNQIKNINP